jgi:ATP-dependent DNA helicase RecQ
MQNSYLQLQNIADAFHVSPHLPTGPVLLVDDIVDSGWSLTLVGWHLRECGVQQVYPFALAKAMGKSGV